MINWIIYIPVLISFGGLAVAIWNAQHSARKDIVETKTNEVDKYIDALKGQVDVLRSEFSDFKNKSQEDTSDLQKRMQACEAARDDLARRNQELEREKLNLLTQIVTAGVTAQATINRK